MKKIWVSALFFAALVAWNGLAAGGSPAFVMRIDDNHSPKEWQSVCDAFEKYGFRCTFAVVSAKLSEPQGACLKELAARGHEIADHTPEHTLVSMGCKDAAEFERVRGLPFVHNSDAAGRRVFFNCIADDSHPANRKIRAKIVSGRLVPAKEMKVQTYTFLKLPAHEGVYAVKSGKDGLTLYNFWGRKLDEPLDVDECEMIAYDKLALRIEEGAVRELARTTRERFDHFGIPRPRSWIAPGGWFPWLSQDTVERIYGREFGYIAAGSSVGGAKSHECRWNMHYNAMYYFDQGPDITPEELVGRIEKVLAKGGDYILLSHMWTKNLPGKFPEYMEKTGRFARLLSERKIRVMTLSELVEERFGKCAEKPK